jgi:hypothetical protein
MKLLTTLNRNKTAAGLGKFCLFSSAFAAMVFGITGCTPASFYARENGHEYRRLTGLSSVLGKQDDPKEYEKAFFVAEQTSQTSTGKFEKSPELTLGIPLTPLQLTPKYHIVIDKGYVRTAKAVHPTGLVDRETPAKVVVSEIGTGQYTATLSANAILAGWFDLGISNGNGPQSDRLVGIKARTIKFTPIRTIELNKGVGQDIAELGVKVKYVSAYSGASGPVYNVSIIPSDIGLVSNKTWSGSPDQMPRLRFKGDASETAYGLVWNGPKGLDSTKDFEYVLPMTIATRKKDAAVVLVGDIDKSGNVVEFDYLTVQADEVSANSDALKISLQRAHSE